MVSRDIDHPHAGTLLHAVTIATVAAGAGGPAADQTLDDSPPQRQPHSEEEPRAILGIGQQCPVASQSVRDPAAAAELEQREAAVVVGNALVVLGL